MLACCHPPTPGIRGIERRLAMKALVSANHTSTVPITPISRRLSARALCASPAQGSTFRSMLREAR